MKSIKMEINHLDIYVTTAKGGQPYRPWLIIGLDLQTEQVVASKLTTQALRDYSACEFLNRLLGQMKAPTLLETIVVDGSTVFAFPSFQKLCERHNIEVIYTSPYQLTLKTLSENVIGG